MEGLLKTLPEIGGIPTIEMIRGQADGLEVDFRRLFQHDVASYLEDNLVGGSGGPWSGGHSDQMYETLRLRGVDFITSLQETPQGLQAVFVDPYGNMFTLPEPR